MTTPSPRFLRFGDAALLVEFGTSVSVEISALVTALDARLAGADIPGLTETAPSFRSLMVQFDPLVTDADEVERAIRAFLPDLDVGEATGTLWRLPACYEATSRRTSRMWRRGAGWASRTSWHSTAAPSIASS